MKIVLFNY